jgi:hypothetical protein
MEILRERCDIALVVLHPEYDHLRARTPQEPELTPAIDLRLDDFDTIELDALRDAPLLDRFESKFVLPAGAIGRILDACLLTEYRVLRVNARPVQSYSTTYYDTPGLALYRAHQAGRATRAKVRIRHYHATGDCFLEVKRRRNTGRTTKDRVAINTDATPHSASLEGLPPEAETVVESVTSRPVVETAFQRITFVNAAIDERVTVDIGLVFSESDRRIGLERAVFVEVKQPRRRSPAFRDAMTAPRLRERSVSKYCLGVALLDPAVKHNRFQPQLRYLQALEQGELIVA